MRIRWTAGKIPAPLVIRTSGDTGREAEPGMESPGASEVVAGLENPSA